MCLSQVVLRVPRPLWSLSSNFREIHSWAGAVCSGTAGHCLFSTMLCQQQARLPRPVSRGRLSPKVPKLWHDRQTLKEPCFWRLTGIPSGSAGEGGPRPPPVAPKEAITAHTWSVIPAVMGQEKHLPEEPN